MSRNDREGSHTSKRTTFSFSRLLANIKNLVDAVNSDYKPTVYAFSIVVITSTVVFFVGLLLPALNRFLSASRSTPWGVVTSLFVHANSLHLASNVFALVVFVGLFMTTNLRLPARERERERERDAFAHFFSHGTFSSLQFWQTCFTYY